MKRLNVRIITLICFLLFLTCIGTDARSEAMEQIDAYLKKNTTIIYNGGTVPQTDKNGKSLFPIVYDGKTYLSIEAVANMLGLELIWDQALQTFYLGQLPIEIDFIEELKPYEKGYYGVNRITNNNFIDIVGKKYDHFINYSGGYAYYNLGGQYTQLRFKAYSSNDTVITFFGDNDALLSKIIIKGKELPLEHRVDLSNVARLVIRIDGYGDIFDAYIK